MAINMPSHSSQQSGKDLEDIRQIMSIALMASTSHWCINGILRSMQGTMTKMIFLNAPCATTFILIPQFGICINSREETGERALLTSLFEERVC